MKLEKVKGTFLDDEFNQSFSDSDVVVLGVAFDGTASYRCGARFGPYAILDASHQLEYEIPGKNLTLNSLIKIHTVGILEFNPDNNQKKNNNSVIEMVSEVKKISEKIIEAGKFILLLGGEHSISNGVFQAISNSYNPKDVTIIQFDAHLDLRHSFDNSLLSHACVMRRARDLEFRTIHIGIRNRICKEENNLIDSENLEENIWWCSSLISNKKNNKRTIIDGKLTDNQISEILNKIETKYCYITFDVDVLDPSIMPGTGTPLPDGLKFNSAQKVLNSIIQHLKKKKIKLIGMDVAEVAPMFIGNYYSSKNSISTISEVNASIICFDVLSWYFDNDLN